LGADLEKKKISKQPIPEHALPQKTKQTLTDMRIAARFETPFDSWDPGVWVGKKQVNAFKENERNGSETERRRWSDREIRTNFLT
jgi:hypothetical protein